MSRRADRSRSPTDVDALKISKAIAGFGRYPSKRPKGLHVDHLGCMQLDDIMRYWGHGQGLEEKDIMHAVRRHMFRETSEGGSLRFALDGDADGRIVVRVMPSQDERPSRNRVREHSLTDMQYDGVLHRAFGMRPPEKRIPKMHGSILKIPGKSPFANGTNGNGKLNGMNGQKRDKLDMSLDDLIQSDQVIDLEADDVGASHHPRREQVLRSFRQMGLHPDTAHLRRAPIDKDGFHGGRKRDDGRGRQRHRWSPAEKVQRWIAWVIQAGYKELGIMLAEGGWVDLAALAAAIPRSRPDFGDFDAEKLKVFIQDSDVDGRFEINPANQLRKVPKDMRKAKSQRSPFERKAAANGTAVPRDPMDTIEVASSASSGRGRRHARSPSLSSDSDGMGPNDDLEDAALAAECENLRVSGDVEEAKPVKAESMRWPQVTVPKPDPPPGEYWTRYQDEGGGEYWYFYDGPLGQWWAGADATTIMAYVADS